MMRSDLSAASFASRVNRSRNSRSGIIARHNEKIMKRRHGESGPPQWQPLIETVEEHGFRTPAIQQKTAPAVWRDGFVERTKKSVGPIHPSEALLRLQPR